MHTADADVAPFRSVSMAVEDSTPPMLDLLRQVDATFREIPHPADSRRWTAFVARPGFRVEFFTPTTGSAELDGVPAPMTALGGAAAQLLRFLDFLIYEPVRAVVLHGAGVPVLVPAPERHAVHKLIVASRRRDLGDEMGKSAKDPRQAEMLISALCALRRGAQLGEVFIEAWDRGPAWRTAITKSLQACGEPARAELEAAVTQGAAALGCDPPRIEAQASSASSS